MELKHFVALTLIAAATGGAALLSVLSQRLRDLMFLLMVAGAAVTERLDVNFLSHEWYRGTSRGIEVSLVDILAFGVLAGSLLVPRQRESRWFWPAGLGFMVIFSIYCAGSVLGSEPKIFGVFELWKLARGLGFMLAAAMFARTGRELRLLVLGLVIAAGLEMLIGLRQRLLLGMQRVPGSIDHPNSLSMYLCLLGPVLMAAAAADFPRWLRRAATIGLGAAAVTVLLTLSRAGVPAFALGVAGAALWCVSWRLTFKKIFVLGAAAALSAGLIIASWGPLMARYGEATLAEEYTEPGDGRGIYLRWAATILEDHPWGVGLNNWSHAESKTYGARQGAMYADYDTRREAAALRGGERTHYAAPAHNLGALVAGELGLAGLGLFSLLWLRWFQIGAGFLSRRSDDPMHAIGVGIFFGIVAVFLQSQTEWTWRHAPIFITFHILVGVLAALHWHRKNIRRAARSQPEEIFLDAAPPSPAEAVAP